MCIVFIFLFIFVRRCWLVFHFIEEQAILWCGGIMQQCVHVKAKEVE